MKKKLFRIIILTLTLALLISVLASCGDKNVDGDNKPSATTPKTDAENGPESDTDQTLAREFWTLDYAASPTDMIYLKKYTLNENGDVIEIFNYNTNKKETFYYEDGRLEYSKTFRSDSQLNTASAGYEEVEKEIYETRYVYEGDKIVRGEVFLNGYPTRSYDEYEYTESGKLDTVKRYELGKLMETYFYNGKKLPQSVKTPMRTYTLEYDAGGNVIKATSIRIYKVSGGLMDGASGHADDESVNTIEERYDYTIEYANGLPAYTVQKSSGGVRWSQREAVISFYPGGDLKNIKRTYSVFNMDGSLAWEPDIQNKNYGSSGNTAIYYHPNGKVKEIHNGSIIITFEYAREGYVCKKIFRRGQGLLPYQWYEFDENGNVTRFAEYDAGELVGSLYQYYPNGNVKRQSETKRGGVTRDVTYDENGNMLKSVNTGVHGTSYTNYLRSDICYTFSRYKSYENTGLLNMSELPVEYVNEGVTQTEYEYNDAFVRIKQTCYENNGTVRVIEFDDNGVRVKETIYDARGNMIRETFYYDTDNGGNIQWD